MGVCSPYYSHLFTTHTIENYPIEPLLLPKYFPAGVPVTTKWLFTHDLYFSYGIKGKDRGMKEEREGRNKERREGNLFQTKLGDLTLTF